MSDKKYKFAEGEKVLCFQGPLIYEAKALKVKDQDKHIKYLIHYAGWNKKWDEWVPENRVLKYNEANIQRQQNVSKQHKLAAKNKKATAKAKKDSSSDSIASTPSKELPTKEPSVISTPAASSGRDRLSTPGPGNIGNTNVSNNNTMSTTTVLPKDKEKESNKQEDKEKDKMTEKKYKFAEGEKVLCFQGPLIYEAKALKVKVQDKHIKYLIHYAGWSKNRDEWVPENRVLKYNEENIQRQQKVSKQHKLAAKSKKVTAKGKKDSSSDSRASTPSKELPTKEPRVTSTPAASSGRDRPSTPEPGNVGNTNVSNNNTPSTTTALPKDEEKESNKKEDKKDKMTEKKYKFAEGEKVLCFQGPLIYEAKALKLKVQDKHIKYLIHYAGWSKNRDEWVPENRVLKYNEENIQRQQKVSKQHKLAAKSKKALQNNTLISATAKGKTDSSSDSRASTPSKELPTKEPSVTSTPAASSGRDSPSKPGLGNVGNTNVSNNNTPSTTTVLPKDKKKESNKKEDKENAKMTEKKYKFAEGEKVLCFQGPLIYEAKALKVKVQDKHIKYLIHYAGWNKKWDEWVPENRVLKYNEENIQRQQKVSKQIKLAAKNKKATAKGKKDSSSDSTPLTPTKELSATSTQAASSGGGRPSKPGPENVDNTNVSNNNTPSTTTVLPKDKEKESNKKKDKEKDNDDEMK